MSSNQQASSDQADFQPTCFDGALSLARVGGDRTFLRELIGVFSIEYPRLLLEIDNAIRAADAAALKRHAHTLKGAMNNFGASGPCASARRLEEFGRDGQLSEAAVVQAELRPAVEELARQLDRFAGLPV